MLQLHGKVCGKINSNHVDSVAPQYNIIIRFGGKIPHYTDPKTGLYNTINPVTIEIKLSS